MDELYDLPRKMQRFLDDDHPIEDIAQRYYNEPFFLYLGRHIGLPVALEGALKLKEISYIPTEAYSAGEMKHGPIALLEEGTPVVVVATAIHVYDKIVSNIQETRARGAHVIATVRAPFSRASFMAWIVSRDSPDCEMPITSVPGSTTGFR